MRNTDYTFDYTFNYAFPLWLYRLYVWLYFWLNRLYFWLYWFFCVWLYGSGYTDYMSCIKITNNPYFLPPKNPYNRKYNPYNHWNNPYNLNNPNNPYDNNYCIHIPSIPSCLPVMSCLFDHLWAWHLGIWPFEYLNKYPRYAEIFRLWYIWLHLKWQ